MAFLADTALITAGLSFGCFNGADRLQTPPAASLDVEIGDHDRLPDGDSSGIEHVVVVMMENRGRPNLGFAR